MYNELKEQGFCIFPRLANKCLDLRGEKETDSSHYVAVLCNDVARSDKAIIMYTAQTCMEVPQEIQNIEVLLDSKHGFVNIERMESSYADVSAALTDAQKMKAESNDSAKDGYASDISTGEDYSTTLLKFTNNIVAEAARRGASDIHYVVNESQAKFKFRIDGVLSFERPMTVTEAREMMSAALQTCGKGFTGLEDDRKEIDVRIVVTAEVEDGRFERIILRLSRRPIEGGYKATMRVIRYNPNAQEIADLGYTEAQEKFLTTCLLAPMGIFVATGPVGTGKSTSLAAMYEKVPEELSGMTIEDPIEYKIHHEDIHQLEIDGNRDDAAEQAKDLFKATLRHDADIVGASEIRDAEMAKLIMEHSNTGKVICSTVHTTEAISTLERLYELGVPLNRLAAPDAWLGILNQRLCPNLCQHCKQELEYPEVGKVHIRNHDGCQHCSKGFVRGRTVCAEILQISEADEDFILAEKWHLWREDLIRRGYRTMALRALEMTQAGQICWEWAVKKIPHAKHVEKHVHWKTEGAKAQHQEQRHAA